ncbi:ribokinase (plasmid) [Phyllobacterium sp. 628]|uniref:ribokinase n=1 Tax=Phyllobacterium sp. 628 TaxID=2718938 RepID=UPI00166227C6|nr:ribokinase [Phyllobacterium sp. 628]QND55027.1 ribokinase [Phyllobacterium sp. 628]
MRAYVIGNITIDEMIVVDELPSSGASILGQVGSHDLGGKGTNQAVVMARCGVATTLVAPVGKDARADTIRHHLLTEPLVSELIAIDGISSDMSLIFRLPGGENAIVTTTESAQNLSYAHIMPVLRSAEPGDLAILQGNLSHQTTRETLQFAKSLGMTTAFNPSPLRPFFSDLWQFVDVVVLNRGEAQALTGTTGEAAAEYLLRQGVQDVVLTLGGDGAMLVNSQGTVAVAACAGEVVDTTGAGDTFMSAALASSLLRGCRLDQKALEHAAQSAAITVSKVGTRAAFPNSSELAAILQ